MRLFPFLACALLVPITLVISCGGNGDGLTGPLFPDDGSVDGTFTPDGGFGGDTAPRSDGGKCVPKSCAQQGFNCGPNGDGCGTLLQCGTCPNGKQCGGGGFSKCGGASPPEGGIDGGFCVPKTCAQQGFNCGFAGDGCGNAIQCGACTLPNICGGGGQSGVCGDTVQDAGQCVNLCTKQVKCDGGGFTTLSGTVYAPTNPALGYGQPDPLYGALVYVPNSTVLPFAPGVTCDQCGAAASGSPLVSVITGPDGKFSLINAPCGTNIPLVIQLGRWRRQIVIPSVACCANTALTSDQTRLPRNQSEGDIPLMAVSTGAADPMHCVLPKIGVDTAEFTDPSGTGRVRLYQDNGQSISAATPPASALYTAPAELAKYDMVLFDCVGSQQNKAATDQQHVIDYANIGGRVFATHYSYVWLFNDPPWTTTANWNVDQPAPIDPMTALIDTSFQKGMDFAAWLANVGALSGPNQISVNAPRHDSDAVNVPPSQRFLYCDPNLSPNNPLEFTFNTPVGATPQCGRVLFSDFHVNTGGGGTGTFPGACGAPSPMTPQEKVLEFMLFDLASCVQSGGPPPPTCTPTTCAAQGFNCGPAGDGCGNLLQCGPCTPPLSCGGGGVSGVCGALEASVCTPKTCQQLGFNCGPAGDGCGNLLQCGNCVSPQTCGGGGTSGVCGGGIR